MSRLRADNLTNRAADGAPLFTHGVRVTGVVTSTTGDFSGNVSVGGTLTYEDVSNVDSVGLITARTGVRVTAGGVQVSDGGLSVTGIATFNDDIIGDSATNISGINSVTATTFYGSGANLSGVESGVANFVASGTIPNGATVVINTDGTVGVVTGISTTDSTLGPPTLYEHSRPTYSDSVYDSTNNRVVIAYTDAGDGNKGTAIVGTVSGDTISFGTPTQFETGGTSYFGITYDSTNDRVVVVYTDTGNSNYGTAAVGTVSGDSISFGTPVVYQSSASYWNSATYDPVNDRVVIFFRNDVSGVYYGRSVVGTVSGNSISFGSVVTFQTTLISYPSPIFDSSTNKVVLSYTNAGSASHGTTVVGTVSGDTISFGTPVEFNSAGTNYTTATFDSTNNKVVIAYQDVGNSNYGTAIVGTVSGTSISFGSEIVFKSASSSHMSLAYDSFNEKVVVTYTDQAAAVKKGLYITGTVSGDSITFGTEATFNDGAITNNSSVFDSNNSKVVNNYVIGNAVGVSIVISNVSSNNENFIGFAGEAISDGETGKINIAGGINASQTGLTTAQTYYVNRTGGISTSISSVVAGTSISSTEIIVKG